MSDLGCYLQLDGKRGMGGTTEANGLRGDLIKVAHGETGLREALVTLSLCREDYDREAAELLEREVWAATALIEASVAVWDRLADPTLRFFVPSDAHEACYLELGRFAHLEALSAPSDGERILIAVVTPAWARVVPHHERELAGHTGALARAYEPISLADAVATLGFATIFSQLEAAGSAAGKILLAEGRAQEARRTHLIGVEQMLGWQPDTDRPPPVYIRALLALLEPDRRWLSGAAFMGLLAVPICLLVGVSYAPLALLPAALGFVIGMCMRFVTDRTYTASRHYRQTSHRQPRD